MPPPPPPGGGAVTVLVDGQPFGAVSYAQAVHSFSGSYILSVQSVSGVNSKAISISLMNIAEAGTYPLGTGANVEGGFASYVENGAGWGAALSGEAGSITLTTLSDTRIIGSFNFTGTEHTGGASGTRTLTSGSFDLPVTTTGTFVPVPDSKRSMLHATVGGQPYVGSTIGSVTSGAIYVVSVINTKYSLSFSFNGLTAPGPYPVSAVPGILSSVNVGPPPGASTTGPLCCWSSALGGSGSVVVATVTPTRVTGSFAFMINPSSGGATVPIEVTGGTFSFGREPAP
ncbi:MAG: DUF6252 family protein [Gemmatimonadota bacterium]